MSKENLISNVLASSPNRRSLLKKIGVASAAVTAAATAGGKLEAQSGVPSPVDVVQFALNLEYLEAEFYAVATSGQTLEQQGVDISGTGASGATTTSYGKVNFGNNSIYTGSVANNIALDEKDHVILLRTALMGLGITPIAKPAINLDALASMGASLQNQQSFLILARIFEDIGVSAYAGGAQYLAPGPAVVLTTAARILAVEGEHVANVRLQLAHFGISVPAIDPADVVPPPAGSNFFTTNTANGLVPIRTPGQVLFLAYGGQANVTKGGFFPDGVNGTLNMSSAAATAANLS